MSTKEEGTVDLSTSINNRELTDESSDMMGKTENCIIPMPFCKKCMCVMSMHDDKDGWNTNCSKERNPMESINHEVDALIQ